MGYPKMHKDAKGYWRYDDSDKLVHQAVAQNLVGGKIYSTNVVHHKDEDKGNFRKGNLQVMSREEHSRLHAKKRNRS